MSRMSLLVACRGGREKEWILWECYWEEMMEWDWKTGALGSRAFLVGEEEGEVQAELDVDDGSLGSEMRRRFR